MEIGQDRPCAAHEHRPAIKSIVCRRVSSSLTPDHYPNRRYDSSFYGCNHCLVLKHGLGYPTTLNDELFRYPF